MRKWLFFLCGAGVCALAASAAGEESVDWSKVSGTYTVPADTTNEISSAEDFNYVKKLSKIVFANENSTLRFAVSTFPSGFSFEGPGTVLMSEKVLLTGDITVKRTLGAGGESQFTRFVFEKGADSSDGATSRRFYFNPSVLTNAVVSFDSFVTNVSFYNTWNGRFELGKNADFHPSSSTMTTANGFFAMRQRGGYADFNNSTYLGQSGTVASYILDAGVLDHESSVWWATGDYLHFRQKGGVFRLYSWRRNLDQNAGTNIPLDFIFDGTAVATNYFDRSTPKLLGAMNLVVAGEASVNAGFLQSTASNGGIYNHNICLNGGELTMLTRVASTNIYYSFNGGVLRSAGGDSSGQLVFGQDGNATARIPVWVRVYEKGGCIWNDNTSSTSTQYLWLPDLREPAGNIVQSIAMSEELEGMVFQSPPGVEIVDSTGSGSNAVAFVEYDFDTGKVAGITVACGGENYSGEPGAVTANLRYRNGDKFLSTPLVCTTGPCAGGDMTLAGGKTIYAGAVTNTYRGATIVDMDRAGEYDHPEEARAVPEYHSLYLAIGSNPRFASTNIIVKSGCLWRSYINGSVSITNYFPDCTGVELRGGHFGGWTSTIKNLTVGGECWLCNHKLNYPSSLAVPADGTLSVDASCLAGGVTPALKHGAVTFADGAKIALADPSAIPANRESVVLLDLSGVATLTGTPSVVQPGDETAKAKIWWNATERRLYGRRYGGFNVIVK